MAMYLVRVEQRIERVVTVEAYTQAEAREMAERGAGAWLDGGMGTSVGIEALDVSRQADEPDGMDDWKYREEA